MTRIFRHSIIKFFDFLAGEWLFLFLKANGGAVVALRSLWTTAIFAGLAIASLSAFDPSRIGPISVKGAIGILWEVSNILTIFLGASYLALYARFVSQWSYLAGLYNLIKQAEAAKDANKDIIAEWKAGYLEDAENLHLAAKANLAPVLHAWVKDKAVIRAYIKNTPGGAIRLRQLRCLARKAFKEEDAKWRNR